MSKPRDDRRIENPKQQVKAENPVTESAAQDSTAKPENDVEVVKPVFQQVVTESTAAKDDAGTEKTTEPATNRTNVK